jgi:FdhD protein
MNARFITRPIVKVTADAPHPQADALAREEPLEIQVSREIETGREWKTVAITMRTPGHDRELAVGFLVGEGLLRARGEIGTVYSCGARDGDGGQNRVRLALAAGTTLDFERLQRNFYMSSSCGVCGKTSLEALLATDFPRVADDGVRIDAGLIRSLPDRLRESQAVFDRTGGLHAAGLFTPAGAALTVREDVGRHNAVDKVIGAQFLLGREPLPGRVLVVSGRASFELVQKTVAAGIPMLVAVGAASSLAVELAEKFGVTLIGFTKPGGFNIYTHPDRVGLQVPELAST